MNFIHNEKKININKNTNTLTYIGDNWDWSTAVFGTPVKGNSTVTIKINKSWSICVGLVDGHTVTFGVSIDTNGGYGYQSDGNLYFDKKKTGKISGYSSRDILKLIFDKKSKSLDMIKNNGKRQTLFKNINILNKNYKWAVSMRVKRESVQIVSYINDDNKANESDLVCYYLYILIICKYFVFVYIYYIINIECTINVKRSPKRNLFN